MAEYNKTTAIKKQDPTTCTSAAIVTATATTTSANSSLAAATASTNALAKVNGIINTLFFDLDNTLIPTRAGDQKAIRKLADVLENQFAFGKEESATATQAFLKAFRRCTDNSQTSLDSWRTYLWRESLPARYKHLAEQIYPIWLQLRYRYVCVPPEFLHMLRRAREIGFLLALITNGPSNAQWEKIRKLNISQYFDCVLVSSDLPWEKPHPNIFHAACNFLGVKPAECAMIGDKLESDIKGGRLAKLGATFWLPLSSMDANLHDVAYPPEFILKNLLDICKYFPILNETTAGGGGGGGGGGSSGGNGSTTAAAAAAHATAAQFRRRSSQVTTVAAATATTTRTCDSDFYCNNYSFSHQHQQQQQQQHHQHHHYQQRHQTEQLQLHYHTHQHHHNHHPTATHPQMYEQAIHYRRAGSLPTDCFGSETENSSDSFFS